VSNARAGTIPGSSGIIPRPTAGARAAASPWAAGSLAEAIDPPRRSRAGRRRRRAASGRRGHVAEQLERLGFREREADAVGLGKTLTASLILAELAARGVGARTLVLTPAGLRDQWRDELARHTGIAAEVVDWASLAWRSREAFAGASPWSNPGCAIVSLDFAIGIVPGWHSTIFPPYFVAGAIYAGFAMVLLIAIPLRWAYGLEDFITMRHLNYMARVMLATGLVVAYGYMMEAFMAWYSGNPYEQYMILNRLTGPYAPLYWALMMCNVVVPQAIWFERVRGSVPALFIIAMFVNVGMWLERFIIVVTSLHRDFLPSSWGMYYPTFWDWSTFIGTIGLFLTLLFLFIRFLPMISIFEMRTLVPEAEVKEELG